MKYQQFGIPHCKMLTIKFSFIGPNLSLFADNNFEDVQQVEYSNKLMITANPASRTSEAKLLMDMSDVLHSSFLEGDFNNNARTADPQNAARHIFASITARLNKDDKVLLRQGGNTIGLNLSPNRLPKYAPKVDRIKSVYHRYLLKAMGQPNMRPSRHPKSHPTLLNLLNCHLGV